MLQLPVVGKLGLVIRDPAFVLRVVDLTSDVNEHGRIGADHFVPMCDTRRNQYLPWPERTGIQSVLYPEGARFRTQVDESHLKHALGRHPEIRLLEMKVE